MGQTSCCKKILLHCLLSLKQKETTNINICKPYHTIIGCTFFRHAPGFQFMFLHWRRFRYINKIQNFLTDTFNPKPCSRLLIHQSQTSFKKSHFPKPDNSYFNYSNLFNCLIKCHNTSLIRLTSDLQFYCYLH
jgi:hypothetical protein